MNPSSNDPDMANMTISLIFHFGHGQGIIAQTCFVRSVVGSKTMFSLFM